MYSRLVQPIGVAIGLLVASVVFLLALDGGGFAVPPRSVLGITLWWAILLVAVLDLLPAGPVPKPILLGAGFLAAFAVWTGLSTFWAPSAEDAFIELARVVLYLGVLVVATGIALSHRTRSAAVGLAIGIVAVATISLVSRFFPDLVAPGPLGDTVASARSRLSFPVDYWNGLAELVALAAPLLLAIAVGARSTVSRSLALVPIPAVVAVSYLASSRGGFLVALTGVLLFLGFSDRRWTALLASVVAAAGSATALALLSSRAALVEAPLSSAARADAGETAALLALICLATGLAHGLLRAAPISWRPRPALGWIMVALAVGLGLAAAAAAEPLERFEAFRRAPTSSPTTVESHLLNVSSTGRWQQWEAAVDQFHSAPLHGGGAGSYGSWWLQHGSLGGFVTEAHSLYLEVLGELGLVGFALLGLALGFAVFGSVRQTLRARDRQILSGLTAAAGAYLVAVAIDWMWELTVVSVVGVACLGLAGGTREGSSPRRSTPRWTRAALTLVAVLAIAIQTIPFLTHVKLRESQEASARGDLAQAVQAADAAAMIQPWAASPHLQLALVSESAGNLPAAERQLDQALRWDSGDWRLWLVATRLHVKQGEIAEARSALAKARRLNPDSPVLARLDEDL